MKKNCIVLFIFICVFSITIPADARVVLSYGNQSNSSGAKLTLYPYEKPEPQVRYVKVEQPNGGYYDEDGYYKSDKRIRRKRGGGSKIIYSAFPMRVPNFGGVSQKPAPVYTHRPIGG